MWRRFMVQPHVGEAQPCSEQHGGNRLLNVPCNTPSVDRLYWPSKWISANMKPYACV